MSDRLLRDMTCTRCRDTSRHSRAMLAAERAKAAPDAAEEERLEEAIMSSRFRFSEANARVLELVVGRHPFLAREVDFHLRARSAVDSSVVASAIRTNSSS